MSDQNTGEGRAENIEPGRNWKLLKIALKNLSDAVWDIHKECPVWANIDGTIPIKVKTLNVLILTRMAADELLNAR